MKTKDNKTERIYFRLTKETKDKFIETLEKNGDTMSGFLQRAIVAYINKNEKEA